MKHHNKSPEDQSTQQGRKSDSQQRERIVNVEEQNDISNEDGHHYDRHLEREEPEEKAINPDRNRAEEEEKTIPKMKGDKKVDEEKGLKYV